MRTCTELCDLGQGLGLYPLNNIGIERVFPVIVQNPIVRSLTEREMLAVGSHQSTIELMNGPGVDQCIVLAAKRQDRNP